MHNNSAWNKAPLKQLKTETGDLNYFDCNNMGTNMEYLAGGLLSADNECWMLLRHKENQQNYLFKIKITSDNRGTSLAKIAITPEVALHLQEATHFASLEGMKDLLFYSTGNSVYAIALSNLREGVTNNLEAQIINGLEDDFSITGMKLTSSSPIQRLKIRSQPKQHNKSACISKIKKYQATKKVELLIMN